MHKLNTDNINESLHTIKFENLKDTNNNILIDSTDNKDELNSLNIIKDDFLLTNKNIDIEKNSKNSLYQLKCRRFGNTFPFWFKNGEPIIVIGPHCIIYFLLFLRALLSLLSKFH